MLPRIRRHARSAIFAIAALVVLTAAGLCAQYLVELWPKLQPGDKGTWSGALGTVLTLFGTIWLATAASRRQAREEHAKAIIAACYLLPITARVEAKIPPIISVLIDDFRITNGVDFPGLAKELEDGGQWANEDLLPFAHLPHHPAAKLATARSQIDYCIKVMRDASTHLAATQQQIGIGRQLAPILDAARAHLAAAREQLTPMANTDV